MRESVREITLWPAPFFVLATMTLASCGAVVDKASEEVIEQVAEGQGLEDFDLNIDEDEGTFSISGTDEEGSFGFGSEVPEGWPARFPLTDDAEGVSSTSFSGSDGEQQMAVYFQSKKSLEELKSYVADITVGLERSEHGTNQDVSGEGFFSIYLDGDTTLTVAVFKQDDGDADVGLTYATVPSGEG